ncbi:hypothetical protein AV545_03780 [Paenibacillus jamilae]|uniref:hypothetical protein n=1 Tax=Paenibacillus jamilae TaxID=114136 RepID=UPI0007AB2837|nr:hypothetical protein [Paenibacillus jamilae]KZE65052.1 hypothetical protein AV545_03780 [Paenibacillus jamilae]
MNDYISTILASSVFASTITALIANFITKKNNDKNLSLKYITEERAKWRQFVKVSASKIYSNKYESEYEKKQLIAHLIFSLNPLKVKGNLLDLKIISLLEIIESGDDNELILKEFRDCIGILLKHDWERSKDEAGTTNKIDDTVLEKILGDFYVVPHERNDEIDD